MAEEQNALYAENCRLGLDLKFLQGELAAARAEVIQERKRAEQQKAHFERRIGALVREVRRLAAASVTD
ncbi:hypothetical protein ACFXKC_40760 [Streptomyces sp. NPDC059340]|uniref:hypothetical protein n=1 Tax=Streptomyces sp. NPDC059340 TaxID=3346806 RepID=UPI0036BAB552